MATANRQEVFRNYGFFLELQGERAGYFTKVSGLGLQVDSIEYREGGMPSTVYKLPGRTRVKDIELSYGITQSDKLARIIDTVVQGKAQRFNCSVVLLGSDGQTEVARWNLGNAWLREFEVADFDALGTDVLIERIVLAAETLERAAGGQAQSSQSGAAA
jgi:phage tail-like protein